MVQDESDQATSRSPNLGRYLVAGGVVAACAMGAGLGLWARPALSEHPPGLTAQKEPAPVETAAVDKRLQIVVNDRRAPLGKPLEVLPAAQPGVAMPFRAAPILPNPQAKPPEQLVRIDAPAPGPSASVSLLRRLFGPPHLREAAQAPTPVLPPSKPAIATPVRTELVPPRPLEVRRLRTAEAEPKPAPVKAASVRATPVKLAVAKPAVRPSTRTHAEHPVRLAKAAPPKHAPKLKPSRAKPDEVELAIDDAPPRARRPLLALAHAIAKLAPKHVKVEIDDQRAEAAPDHARKASLREPPRTTRKSPPKIEHYVPPLSTKGAGPIRVANVRCASPDPGEALVCGDPALAAADRRLSRAYHEAEAAGVPHATLEQQQQRWLAARAAAAREAPWAVRDVYQARIAELNDMARDAQGN